MFDTRHAVLTRDSLRETMDLETDGTHPVDYNNNEEGRRSDSREHTLYLVGRKLSASLDASDSSMPLDGRRSQ